MNVDVVTTIVINRPVEVVAAYAIDPDNAPVWYVNIVGASWITERPLKIGSQVQFTAKFLGRRLVYTYEITKLEPGQKLVMGTAEGPFPMETTYTFRAISPDRSEMTLRNRGTPSGFSRLLAPLMVPAMRRANGKDLTRLRALLEAESSN